MYDRAGFGVRRNQDERHARAVAAWVAVLAALELRRGHVIVVSPAVVPCDDDRRVLPILAARDRVHKRGDECLGYVTVGIVHTRVVVVAQEVFLDEWIFAGGAPAEMIVRSPLYVDDGLVRERAIAKRWKYRLHVVHVVPKNAVIVGVPEVLHG